MLEQRKISMQYLKQEGQVHAKVLLGCLPKRLKLLQDDINLLKQVLGLLTDAGCSDSDLFYEAAENLYKQEKSALAAYSSGRNEFRETKL